MTHENFDPVAAGPCQSLAEAAVHLRRPFTPELVRAKLQAQGSDWAEAVFFVDARAVIDRLNVLLPGLWHADFDVVEHSAAPVEGAEQAFVYRCRLTAAEATYADVGEGFDHKAARSDALKRAAVHLGIGHCLYRIAPIRMAAGGKAHQLRGQPSFLELDDANHRWLRGRYRAWLTRTGNAEYGLPLHHGQAARSVAPELFPDRAPARRPRAAAPPPTTTAPVPRPPVLLPPPAASSAGAAQPPTTATAAPAASPTATAVAAPAARPTATAVAAPAASSTATTTGAPAAASPPLAPTALPYGAPRPPRPQRKGEGTPAAAPTGAAPATAITRPTAPAGAAPATATTRPTAPAPATATPAAPEQRAALSEIARRLGYSESTLQALARCVHGAGIGELGQRALQDLRAFLDSAAGGRVTDTELAARVEQGLREAQAEPPRERLARWLLAREERAAAEAA